MSNDGWAQHQNPQPQGVERPWWKKKRFNIPLGVVVALVLVGIVAPDPEPDATVADAGAAATQTTQEPTALKEVPEATAAAEGQAVTPSEEETQAVVPTKVKPTAPPSVTYRGRGDRILKIRKPESGAVLLDAKYTGGSNFVIQDLQAQLLVNTIGSYRGTTLLDANDETTRKLKIQASGPWTIVLKPRASAKVFTVGARGRGDNVLMYRGGSATIAMTYTGTGNFVVQAPGAGFDSLIANEIGKYKGENTIDEGPQLVSVQARGSWKFTIDE